MTGIKRLFRAIPLLMRLGFITIGVGGAADVVLHGAPAEWHMATAGFGEAGEQVFHVVTLIGMCMILLGVLTSRSHSPQSVLRTVEVREEEVPM